jgi:4'-phosphopantetheinyl transferase EntD
MISHPPLKTTAVLTPKQAFLQNCAVAGIEVEIAQLTDKGRQLPERRKAESVLARRLAREGLQRHGVADVNLERHADGFTLWPAGWAGSLAHSGGWCVAALARTAQVRCVGIDVEDPARMKPALWGHIMAPAEQAAADALAADAAQLRAAAVFSAKEAVYKAIYPLLGSAPGFQQAELQWQSATAFRVSVPPKWAVQLQGCAAVFDGMLFAVVWQAAA